MKNLKKQAGFTLIELVVVIVILGILAATAAPKFIDLTGDARGSTVEAVKASLFSARDMAHAKSLVEGTANGSISFSGQNITFVNGWPNEASIGKLLDLEVGGDLIELTATPGTFTHAKATTAATCVAVYEDSAATKDVGPTVTANTAGC